MRAFVDEHGVKRINAKIEIPMSHADVSAYIMSAVDQGRAKTAEVLKLNKRELLRLAKTEIWDHGVEAPLNNNDNIAHEDEILIRNYVKTMFPELT